MAELRSKIGFHGYIEGIESYWSTLDAAGIPFVFKSVDDVGKALQAASFLNAKHKVILRYVDLPGAKESHPNLDARPRDEAMRLWDALKRRMEPDAQELWDKRHRIWLEPFNEIDAKENGAWLGQFLYHFIDTTLGSGWRFALPGFNAGQPEPQDWSTIFSEFLTLVSSYPDELAISVHEGKTKPEWGDIYEPLHTWTPWMVGRVNFIIEWAGAMGLDPPNIFVSEWAWGYKDMPDAEFALQEIDELAAMYAQWPTVLGVYLWTLHRGAKFGNLRHKLKQLIPAITHLSVTRTYGSLPPGGHEGGQDPPQGEDDPGQGGDDGHSEPGPIEEGVIFLNFEWSEDDKPWTDQGIQQVPDGWEVWSAAGATELPDAGLQDWSTPEAIFRSQRHIRQSEWHLLLNEQGYAYKIFSSYRPWWVRLTGPIIRNAQPGQYRLSVLYFDDCYVDIIAGGEKVAAPDRDSFECRLGLGMKAADWKQSWGQSFNVFKHEINLEGPADLYPWIEWRGRWGLRHVAAFVHWIKLERITEDDHEEEPPMPLPTAIIDLVPQDTDEEDWLYVYRNSIAPRRGSVTHSHHDAANQALSGNPETSKVILWAKDRRSPADIAQLHDWGVQLEFRKFPNQPQYEIVDIVGALPHHSTRRYATREPDNISTVTIHHTVSPTDRPISGIAEYHVNSKGWPGIGYHFVIKASGEIFKTNYLGTISYHAGSFASPNPNTYAIGVALQGTFTDDPPPQAQLDATRWLVGHLREQLNRNLEVKGHRDMPRRAGEGGTQCPGNTYQEWLPYVGATGSVPDTPSSFKMRDYILGDGRLYTLQTSWGPSEQLYTLDRGNGRFWQVKGNNVEGFLIRPDGTVARTIDTSPNSEEFYIQKDRDAEEGAMWCGAEMEVGDLFERSPVISFFFKSNCQPSRSPYMERTWFKLLAHHPAKQFASGIVLEDVVEGTWLFSPDAMATERYFYARHFGLVAWEGSQGSSWISEISERRPDWVPSLPACLQD